MASVISRCIERHHSLKSSLFICDNNENGFMNGMDLAGAHCINIHAILVRCQSTGYMMILIDDQSSELIYYRRFAIIMDIIFSGIDVSLDNGEAVAEATKMAQQASTRVATSCFGRKIDLLLNIKGMKVSLTSNEWKSAQTHHIYYQQQSKNFLTNCSILNGLIIQSNGEVSKLVAINFIGTIGYMYYLELKDSVYIATTISTLLLLTGISQPEPFKKRGQQFFGVIRALTSDPNAFPTTLIFFTPKSNRTRETEVTEEQEEQED